LFNTGLLNGADAPLLLSRFEKLVLRQGETPPHAFITSLPAGPLKETLRKVFPDALAKRTQPLAAWAQWHSTALGGLAQTEAWHGSACAMVTELLQTLSEERDAQMLTLQDYHELVHALCAGRTLQPTYQVRCPVALLNPREARLLTFDHVIIAAMNEGIWPAASAENPWLTAAMMRHLGLPTAPDYAGLAAHDLVQWGAQARRITLTRARSADGSSAKPSRATPSRWWWRLQPYAASSSATLATYRHWLDMMTPYEAAPAPEVPSPCPPSTARPRRVSVTAMETLLRNPYEFYVRQVLRLRSLEPLQGDRRTLGRQVHALLEQWVHWLTELASAELASAEAVNPFDPDEVLPLLQGRLGWTRHGDDAVRSLFLQARLRRIFVEFLAREQAHQSQVRARWVELTGEATLTDVLGEPFVLLAKADRLDLLNDGAVEFYDYKTGQVPSLHALKQGHALQLPLECAIFARGGFAAAMAQTTLAQPRTDQPQITATHHVRALHYWQLKGGAKPAKWVSLAGPDLPPVVEQAERLVGQVMAHFQGAPYVYQDDGFAGPIAHLARVTAGSCIASGPTPSAVQGEERP
jgi:ATP-dependent helicase/nuclease subunit B